MPRPPVTVVFGARNVGRAVAARRLAAGGRVLAVARTAATLDALAERHPGVHVMHGDATRHAVVEEALTRAQRDLGGLDLVVNAITAPPRDHAFGGGPIIDAPPDRLQAWLEGFVPAAWAIMHAGGAALATRGAGTLVQVAGGSARRAIAGRAMWGAAQHAARALAMGLAQELRPQGVHVALLIADGIIRTERAPMEDRPSDAALDPDDVAAAVDYLAAQGPRAWSHELTLTPRLETWVP